MKKTTKLNSPLTKDEMELKIVILAQLLFVSIARYLKK